MAETNLRRAAERNWKRILATGTTIGAIAVGGCGGEGNPNTDRPLQQPLHTRVILPGSRHLETQQFGANAFENYYNASGVAARLKKGVKIIVDCLATGPKAAAPSADGKWYHIEWPHRFESLYAAANTFENGDITGVPLDQQNPIDPSVPPCPTP